MKTLTRRSRFLATFFFLSFLGAAFPAFAIGVGAYQNQDLAIGQERYKELLQKTDLSFHLGGGVDLRAEHTTLFHLNSMLLYHIDPYLGIGPILHLGYSASNIYFEMGGNARIYLPFAETLPLRLFTDAGVTWLYRRERTMGVDFHDVGFHLGGGVHYFPLTWLSLGPEYMFHISNSALSRYYHSLFFSTTLYY